MPEATGQRRWFLQGLGGAIAAPAILSRRASAAERAPLTFGLPQGDYDTAVLEALPGKRPLIKLTTRPPNFETPASYFATAITPNDAFFVRYHLAGIPQQRIDVQQWKLAVGGEGVTTPLQLSFADLQSGYEQVEITAVCQCSGNRRGLSIPHVPGVQWGLGAMGNAVWRGPRLKDVLGKAGLETWRRGDRRRWRRCRGAQRHPRFREKPASRQGDGREHHHCIADERRVPSPFQRLPGAADRSGLDRNLLDEAAGIDSGRSKTL
jgi:hypothetical protein